LHTTGKLTQGAFRHLNDEEAFFVVNKQTEMVIG